MSNPRGQQRDKPFRDALRMEVAGADGNFPKLRAIAKSLIEKASGGDVNAIKEVADRLDGKVPQAIAGADGESPLKLISKIEVVIVDPKDRGS